MKAGCDKIVQVEVNLQFLNNVRKFWNRARIS